MPNMGVVSRLSKFGAYKELMSVKDYSEKIWSGFFRVFYIK